MNFHLSIFVVIQFINWIKIILFKHLSKDGSKDPFNILKHTRTTDMGKEPDSSGKTFTAIIADTIFSPQPAHFWPTSTFRRKPYLWVLKRARNPAVKPAGFVRVRVFVDLPVPVFACPPAPGVLFLLFAFGFRLFCVVFTFWVPSLATVCLSVCLTCLSVIAIARNNAQATIEAIR